MHLEDAFFFWIVLQKIQYNGKLIQENVVATSTIIMNLHSIASGRASLNKKRLCSFKYWVDDKEKFSLVGLNQKPPG